MKVYEPSGRRLVALRGITVIAVWLTIYSALAHVNSGANCASCHTGARDGMTLTSSVTITNPPVQAARLQPGRNLQ